MGQSFERILALNKETTGLSLVPGMRKAAAEIGYSESTEGIGISVRIRRHEDSEWYEIESPLLGSTAETAEPFLRAISREVHTPVLFLCCVDSDFVYCRLIDSTTEIDTGACLGEPYVDVGEPDYNAWAGACKKKWKCTAEQFREVFEGDYVFAEEGLEPLAALMHFSPVVVNVSEDEPADRIIWFSPSGDGTNARSPQTLLEKAADFMETEYADKLVEKGFQRFKNSPLRWHKLVGDEGNEVLQSIVITSHYDWYEIFYGAQSLYCPVVFSDKYYPHHDNDLYWLEARFEYVCNVDKGLFYIEEENPELGKCERMLPFDDPQQFRPILERLIFPALDRIVDLTTCHDAYMQTRLVKLYKDNPKINIDHSRLWLEAFLSGDEALTKKHFALVKQLYENQKQIARNLNIECEEPLVEAFGKGDMVLFRELLDKTYATNMKNLRNAGVVQR